MPMPYTRPMQILDFSFEPFVSVCEKDIANTYSLSIPTQIVTSTEITECRNPSWDFWIFLACIIGFVYVVYKIACRIKR